MDFPIKNGGSFHSYVNVYQRVMIHCHEFLCCGRTFIVQGCPRCLRKGLQIIATTIDYGVLPTTGEPSSIRPWPQDACGRARTIGLSCVEYLLQRTWGWRCSGPVSIEGNTLKAAINYGGQQIVADSWRMLQEYLKISKIGSLAN